MVPFELDEGTVFAGDFRVLSPLARGGMGAVYVAEQASTGKRRALKIMSPMLADDAKARERFVQEARVGALVDSEHVVEVIAAGVDEATRMPWLAMELLEGETLGARLERGAIPLAEVKEIAAQLRHALAEAHARGIVHRDLKPENLFLERPRRAGVPFTVKVLDFGIAKLVQQARDRHSGGTQSLGSPLWMAPEQANAHTISPATDVWSLGLIAFAAITGKPYWRAAAGDELHLTRLLVEILVDPLAPASLRAEELRAQVVPGEAFDAWLARCVNRSPEARFAEAGACLDELARVIDAGDFRANDEASLGHGAAAITSRASAIDPESPTVPIDASEHEPIVRRDAPPTREGAKGSLGLGQIAALIAGTTLIALLAVFGGLGGYAVFTAQRAEDAVVSRGLAGPHGLSEAQPTPPTPITSQPAIERAQPPTPPSDAASPDAAVDAASEPARARPPAPAPPAPRDDATSRALYAGTIGPCWQEELVRNAPGPTRLEVELIPTADGRGVANVRLPERWRGTPFAECIVRGLPRTRFATPPTSHRAVLMLPGAR
ncbi:MAG: serine/threonine protein kinase [Sandaracinaceae bacterium]|nr:serine/threonine protein kinase [Sandaracinaceae bacterium]